MLSFSEFLKLPNCIERLLHGLDIITHEKLFVPIDYMPDYDLSEYQGAAITNYFFQNSWDFNKSFQSVVEVDFIESHIIHADTLNELSREYNIPYDHRENATPSFLLKVYQKDKTAISSFGYEMEAGDFKVNKIKLISIDNIHGTINYQGSFIGNSSDIDPVDWGVYSLLLVTGIPKDIDLLNFYKVLLSESYVLYKENKFKLAYFIAYSAFENFINFWLGTGDEGGARLVDRFKELFKSKFSDFSTHQIYTSVAKEFNPYTANRNTIAHGRTEMTINKQQVKDALLFVLILIGSFEFNCSSFDQLTDILNKKNKNE